MKIQAKVTQVKGKQIAVEMAIQKFKVGDKITISKGGKRSLKQNNFYWQYLTYLVVNHLQNFGHFCPMGLHESLKQHFLSEKKMQKGEWKAIEGATTTELSRDEFVDYIEKIDNFVSEFFKIDTSEFWQEYMDMHRPGG